MKSPWFARRRRPYSIAAIRSWPLRSWPLLAGLVPAVWASLLVSNPSAATEVPLDDGKRGMTCHFYAAAARLDWLREGGDWIDADGRAFGERPFASTQVPVRGGLQPIAIDLTALARAWNAGEQRPGGVFLKAIGKAGVVNIASREHQDAARRPVLLLEWSDGQRQTLSPEADTFTACPTHKSLGESSLIKVSDGYRSILVFPFERRAGQRIASATLRLTSDKQYQRSTEIGAFALAPPNGRSPVQAGIAASVSGDAGIERHPDVIHFESFESGRWETAWSDIFRKAAPRRVASDSSERFEALQGQALKATVPKGSRTGLSMHFRFAKHGGEPDEAFFRYYLRFGDSWDPVKDGGKLPGLAGTYERAGWGGRGANGSDGWSARGAFFQLVASDEAFARYRSIGSYVYHKHSGKYGSILGWNLGPTGLLEKNRWYSVEQQVKMNTPGKPDGVLRAWIDGQLVMERTDLHFRDVPELKVESVWMNVYHGGITDAHQDLSLYIDNLVIARRYIGPMGR